MLSLARQDGAQYGPEIVFTYGPWGFLDAPVAVDPVAVALGVVFAVTSVSVGWWALWQVLRRCGLRADLAGGLAALTLVVVASPLGVSNLLLVGLIALLALHVADPAFEHHWWVPAAAAGGGAFLLQVKLSVGACVLGAVALACAFAPRQPMRRAVEAVASAAATFLGAWLLVGQDLADLPTWLARSVEVVGGYSEAMGRDPQKPWLSYGLAAGAVVATAVALWAGSREAPRRARLGLLGLGALSAYYGYRQGFGRFDLGHRPVFYVALLPFVLWVVAARPRAVTRWALLGLVLVLGRNGQQVLEPHRAVERWDFVARVVFDDSYRGEVLDRARAAGRAEAGLGPSLRNALGGPVSVDGYSAGVAWMEGRDLTAPPVFQSYVAYTGDLDERNAEWLRQAPAGHLVLRPVRTAIDGRNSLWDPPRYVLEEMCRTRVVATDGRWLLLVVGDDRCRPAVSLGEARVRAGETVGIPRPEPGAIVIMSFQPEPPGTLDRLGSVLAANSAPLFAAVDGRTFRLPRALADGPLIAAVPPALGWPASHGGSTAYQRVAFNRVGTVSFRAVPVRAGP